MAQIYRVVCGVSGGVDSSVAALLLKHKGYDVAGVFMRNWDGKDETGVCQADKDAEDAERTCRLLGIPFREVNFIKEYWNNVFVDLLRDYQSGLTPNPDILCNYHIKFDSFVNHAREKLNADLIATGHYAQTSPLNTLHGVKLLTAQDTFKDQTFFLSHVKQAALQYALFPIGHLLKSQVRQIAKDFGLNHVASRPDSTGMCFIGKRSFPAFITEYLGESPGPFIDLDTGKEVGKHQGIHMWTLGQRCKLPGHLKAYYVASKSPETRTIHVVSGEHHPSLYSRHFRIDSPHWIHSIPTALASDGALQCQFRFQHTKPLTQSRIVRQPNGWEVVLERPLRALTPGQYAVFYLDNECLGCARIVEIFD